MVLPTFVRQALRGEPLTVHGDGEQRRCFSYVGDVVEALVRLAQTPEAVGEVINIGNDQEVTINELAALVKEITGSPSRVRASFLTIRPTVRDSKTCRAACLASKSWSGWCTTGRPRRSKPSSGAWWITNGCRDAEAGSGRHGIEC